jgi:hypothetical protein
LRTKRDELAEWIRDYLQPNFSALVAPLLEAADAFDRLKSGRDPGDKDLAKLVEVASTRSSLIGDAVAPMLGELAQTLPSARAAIVQLSKNRQLEARINALAALESFGVCETHEEVTKNLLHDRTARVRELAADKIRKWRLISLLPDLEIAIGRERNSAFKKTLELQRDLIRDGYRVDRMSAQELEVTFQKPGGGLVTKFVNETEWQAKGLSGIARAVGVDPNTLNIRTFDI